MKTMLKTHTGAPGDGIFTIGNLSALYQAFDSRVAVVENFAPEDRNLSPAELPRSEEERMSFIHQYAFAVLEEEEEEELDEDLDMPDEAMLDEADEEVSDEDLDDDLALELDEDDDEDDIV